MRVYPVKMANSRGPESLKDLAARTGAIPVSVEQVGQDVDMLFIVVPQKSIPELPERLLNRANKETALRRNSWKWRIDRHSEELVLLVKLRSCQATTSSPESCSGPVTACTGRKSTRRTRS